MKNVAIIGGGAAGSGAAWQLFKKAGTELSLTLYEREEHVGGRVWDTTFSGCSMEIGGSLLHSTGQLTNEMMEFTGCKEGVSSLSIDGKNETYAFWTNKGFPVCTRTTLASMAIGILKHVGIPSALRVTNSAKQMAEKFEGVYTQLREHTPFTTPDELFAALDLLEPTKISTVDFYKQIKVNNKMANDIVEAITHNMYNQGAEMNALASLVGLAGAGLAGGHLFVIDGGNWTLYDKMIKKAGIKLELNTKIEKIIITSRDGLSGNVAGDKEESTSAGVVTAAATAGIGEALPYNYQLRTDKGETFSYDAVILAAPPALADLEIELNGKPYPIAAHPYQEVQTTLVVGSLRPEYFGQKPGTKMPSTVFTASSAPAPFKSIGTTGWSPIYDSRIYKIFSADHVMTEAELHEIFEIIHETYLHVWRGAYPVLKPGIEHLPFELNRGLYFANALETIAGSIEVETVSGVNAANLCLEYLFP